MTYVIIIIIIVRYDLHWHGRMFITQKKLSTLVVKYQNLTVTGSKVYIRGL